MEVRGREGGPLALWELCPLPSQVLPALSLRSDSGLALACWLQSLCPLPCPRGRPSLGPLALAVSGSGGVISERKKTGRKAGGLHSQSRLSQSVAALQLRCFKFSSLRTFRYGGSGNGNGNCPGRRPGPGELTTDLSHCQCVALSRSLSWCKGQRRAVGQEQPRAPPPGRARLEGRCSAQQEHGPIRRNSPRQPWKFPWHRPSPNRNLSSSWVARPWALLGCVQ